LLTQEDVQEFDRAMIKAIPFCRTRSKTGQAPRLYLRVQATDGQSILKDLREFVSLNYLVDNEYTVRSVQDFSVDITRMVSYLSDNKIETIHYWKDDELSVEGWEEFLSEYEGRMVCIETD